MKAILQPVYGLPDVLQFAEVDRPSVRDDGVLVRVLGASVNKGDWHLLTGKPYLVRLAGFGLLKPNKPIPGMAVAGRVEAVGSKITAFKPGDEVFGEINRGGFAEYVCAGEQELAHKPPRLTFAEAATLPIAATTALQGLRNAGLLQSGQSVLINGASGGVGTFAVQIAKALGAEVTAVCSGGNVEWVRSLGADHVIDYSQQDFTRIGRRHDVIFDLVGNQPLSACRRALHDKGRFVSSAGGADREWTGPLFFLLGGLLSNLFSSQVFVPLMAVPCQKDLITLCGFIEAGQVKPVIDRTYTLPEVAEALRYQGEGHTRGKNVITL